MKTVLVMVAFLSVLLSVGCASYTGCEYRRNIKNYGATKMGFPLDSNASYLERNALRRHVSMARIKNLPFYGDSTGYRGFVINTSQSEAIDYQIYDKDGVLVASGLLKSVWREQQYNYMAECVVDTHYIPFGTYRIVAKYLDGRTSYGSLSVPSPSDTPFGLKGQWHKALY
jgi:hypothetical protein